MEEKDERTILTRRKTIATAAGLVGAIPVAALANTQFPPQPKTGRADPQGRFAGKVVLVTGATSGIGEATARAFALEGAKVYFCGRRQELGRNVESAVRALGGEATYQRADVREADQIKAFVDNCVSRYGRLDVAFNNAGTVGEVNPFLETALDDWHNVLTTNATGVFLSMKNEIPYMLKQGGGVIINTASVSSYRGFLNIAPYGASKHAILSLTKTAALAFAAKNIRISSIAPGGVDTAMLRYARERQGIRPEQGAMGIPIHRTNTVEEIARAVLFLSSDDATSFAGSNVDVTGGMLD
ncbi:SDR family NAD(P)-dependent oxidoreductase [Gloeobacter kilaueensis]|uniref:Short-chain dehydrogenase/reductase SDR n=1 Tax=Gloeobacter kilaueensis (strain ATCC BAA-2537 / CCAP 1431/1 / ULC 316 / JS1) TaxID=1183438 RepID=U5QN54_GLOK1|nr:SDR family oxidoreductase [Gloeobacter kilaueensis]AGY60341.1 short-chain dehydrogenase/reductase SDR [Gloeobacter kilaueensis JS1]